MLRIIDAWREVEPAPSWLVATINRRRPLLCPCKFGKSL
jgi:hypothetical protein